jgi:hypothetical protein
MGAGSHSRCGRSPATAAAVLAEVLAVHRTCAVQLGMQYNFDCVSVSALRKGSS